MGYHVSLYADDVLAVTDNTIAMAKRAAEAHKAHAAALARLDDPPPGVAPLTQKQRFDALAALRKDSLAKAASPADVATARTVLGEFAQGIDVRALAARARFLPPVTDPASTASDLRILAEQAVRAEYRARIARMGPDDVAAEAARLARRASGDLQTSDVLAHMHELDIVTTGREGDGWAKARASIGGAFSAAEDGWAARAHLVESIGLAIKATNATEAYGAAIAGPPGAPLGVSAKSYAIELAKAAA